MLPGNGYNQGFYELKKLDLSYNQITDEGVKLLCAALTHTNCKLNSLVLHSNRITDEAVKHLYAAFTHTNCKLNVLTLLDNKITQKDKNLLKSININCVVVL